MIVLLPDLHADPSRRYFGAGGAAAFAAAEHFRRIAARCPRCIRSDGLKPPSRGPPSSRRTGSADCAAATCRLRAMGLRDKPIAPGSPWQNGFAERLIGSIRRECVGHMVVLGEAHLRQILQSYARYYNEIRTHRSLNDDAPLTRPVQRSGHICRVPWSAATSPICSILSLRHTKRQSLSDRVA
jgi:transposase InsO family protein